MSAKEEGGIYSAVLRILFYSAVLIDFSVASGTAVVVSTVCLLKMRTVYCI